MKKNVTIHDLARILNKDSSTISRALANSPRVKKKTRDLIQSKAIELGYSRNTLASNLRERKTNTIGVIVPHISRFFLSSVIAGIEAIAFDKGYRVIICQSMDQLERERQLVQTLLSHQVDGMIISISMETNQFDHLMSIANQEIPVVFVDRKCEAVPATNMVIDDFARAFEATEHLIDQGCRSIAHFTGSEKVSIYKERLDGYIAAMDKHDIAIEDHLIIKSQLKPADGQEMAKYLVGLTHRPEGLFSANDLAAIAAIQVFQQQGISIPDDLAIVGFSNEPLGAYMHPPLTSVDQNPHKMGNVAAQILISQIEEKIIANEINVIDSSLIIRKSSLKKGFPIIGMSS